jgi:hypothetical protein
LCEVGGSVSLQGCAGPPGVESCEVDGGGGEDVFEIHLADTGVAGFADSGQRQGLADGAFDTGAGAVAVFPFIGGLLGPGVAREIRRDRPAA